MATKKGNILVKTSSGKANFAPNTITTCVADPGRGQALSASLESLIEKNALGYPTFSTLSNYPVGGTVFYDRKLWTFTTAHPAGAWNASHVREANIKELLIEAFHNIDGDVTIHENLTVGGVLRASGIKQPNCGLFSTLAKLQAAYPTPEVGMWATVGNTIPGEIYVCETAGVWTDSGQQGGSDPVDLTEIEERLDDIFDYQGVATPNTEPGTPDHNVYYLAGAGVYENFGSTKEIPEGSVGIIKYDGEWKLDLVEILNFGEQKDYGQQNVNRQSYSSFPTNFKVGKEYKVKLRFDGYIKMNLFISKEDGYVPASSGATDFTKLQTIAGGIETSDTYEFSVIPEQPLYNILFYSAKASSATLVSLEVAEKGFIQDIETLSNDVENIKLDLELNNLTRVEKILKPVWNTGGYYKNDGITLVSGLGFYTDAIDISEFAGKSLIVYANQITENSIRAIVVVDGNDNIVASMIEKDFALSGNNSYKAVLPLPDTASNVYLSISTKATKKDVYIVTVGNSSHSDDDISHEFWVDGTNGDDNNDGSKDFPFATFAKLRYVTSGIKDVVIHIASGVYDETLYLDLLKGDVKVYGDRTGAGTIITGAGYITGWSPVSGHAGVYQCAFSGTIPTHGNYNQGRGIIYEDVPSLPILDAERHPAQKGLSYRLPFTMIQQCTATTLEDALAELDVATGWYLDSGVLYMRNSDGTNPMSRNYAYQDKGTLSMTDAINRLEMSDISFRFTKPVAFKSKFTERYNCSVFGCSGDGFVDSSDCLRSYYDECAACGNDGANGHYNIVESWQSQSLRISGEMCEYYYPWCHDNYDDGLSHHEASHVRVVGGLFEYNGDGGIRISNTGNCEVITSMFRKNGQDNDSGASRGSGFDLVNAPLSGDSRQGSTAVLYGCTSESNRYGYAVWNEIDKLVLVNCLSSDSEICELYAKDGLIVAKRCAYRQDDSSKVKNVAGTGVVNIEEYDEFVNN